jgi:hypothetical protein
MDFSYQNLRDIGIFPLYAKITLTEGAMAEILAFYIYVTLDQRPPSKTIFLLNYLMLYDFKFSLLESNIYLLDQLDLLIEELNQEVKLEYQADKRFEVKFSDDQEQFMATFEYQTMHREGYDGSIGAMLFSMINEFGPTDILANKRRLMFEIYTLAFLMRKYMSINNRDGAISKIIYLPKYHRPRKV